MVVGELLGSSSGAYRCFTHCSTNPNPDEAQTTADANPPSQRRSSVRAMKKTSKATTHVTQRRTRSHGKVPRRFVFQPRPMMTRRPHVANGDTAIASISINSRVLWLIFSEVPHTLEHSYITPAGSVFPGCRNHVYARTGVRWLLFRLPLAQPA